MEWDRTAGQAGSGTQKSILPDVYNLRTTELLRTSITSSAILIEAAEKLGHNVVMKARAFAVKRGLYQILVVAPNEELIRRP